nr:MAG TPA: hypothetical protein [Caudoviricetes sp.]
MTFQVTSDIINNVRKIKNFFQLTYHTIRAVPTASSTHKK